MSFGDVGFYIIRVKVYNLIYIIFYDINILNRLVCYVNLYYNVKFMTL